MALDAITIKDAANVDRDIVGKFNASNQFQQGVHLLNQSRADTFTGTGAGTAVASVELGVSHFALQVKETGTVTSWTVVVQVSLDGTNYVTILTHTKAGDGDGAIVFSGPNRYPALYFRANCTAVTLGGGTNVIATIVGMP